MPNERTRAYIYRIAVAVLSLLVLYGILAADEVQAWTAVIVALLGLGPAALASANTDRSS